MCVIKQVMSVGSPLELNPIGDPCKTVEYAPELSQPRDEEARVFIHWPIGRGCFSGCTLRACLLWVLNMLPWSESLAGVNEERLQWVHAKGMRVGQQHLLQTLQLWVWRAHSVTIKLRDTSKLKDRQLGYGTVKHETLYQKHESFMWYRKSHLLTKVGLPEFLSLLFPEPFAYKYFSVCNPFPNVFSWLCNEVRIKATLKTGEGRKKSTTNQVWKLARCLLPVSPRKHPFY